VISVKNIYKNFGDLSVLKGVSCNIKAGEKVAIIGPSGSGKSTLLRCMNLLEEPSLGEVWLENTLLTNADPYLHNDIIKASHTYKALLQKVLVKKMQFKKSAMSICSKKQKVARLPLQKKLTLSKTASTSTSPVKKWAWSSNILICLIT
jgi:ABC-type polar amino acid transport system ATPase subunit